MKKWFIFIALLLISKVSGAEALKTGSQLKQLPSPLYLDDSNKQFSEFLGKKKFIVIHIWEMNQSALSEFYPLANIAAKLRDDVQFLGIGIGEHNQLKRFPGAVRLGFPVNSDRKGAAKELLLRKSDQLPLTVILDKNGTVLWRGPFRQMSPVLKKCLDGKFDLPEQIRVENFAEAVSAAVSAGEIDKALAMIAEEYKKHPGKTDLLHAQISLYKKLNKLPEAFRILHEAQQRSPENYRIFEIEYRLIGENNQLDKLPEFFTRLKKNFAGKPHVLMAFAIAECKLPPENLQLKHAFDLAETGWKSQAFKTPVDKGLFAMDYASILHLAGRNDLAVELAKIACENLKGKDKYLPKAEKALLYYSKLNEIAPALKLPDLKK